MGTVVQHANKSSRAFAAFRGVLIQQEWREYSKSFPALSMYFSIKKQMQGC